MKPARVFLILVSGAVFTLAPAAQAALRRPTHAEQKALDKYVTAIGALFDQFLSDDWDETTDYSVDAQVYVHPNSGRPLDVDEMFQHSYNARPGSARFNAKLQPLVDELEATNDMQEKIRLGAEIQKLSHLRVEVHFNRVNLGDIEPAPPQNRDLRVTGAAVAYKIRNNVSTPGSAACVLAFGHWEPLQWNAQHHWYRFTFAHPVNTPYIENIEIRIYGAPDRIDELLHNVDWRQVNQALTP